VGSEHVLREPCRALVVAIRSADVDATSTPEVIQEFAHARARRHGRSEAVALAREFAGLLSPLLVVQEEHLRPGLALYERHPGLGAFDAVLGHFFPQERAEFTRIAEEQAMSRLYGGIPLSFRQ